MNGSEKTQEQRLKRNLWAYPIGTIGRDMANTGLFSTYLLSYIMFTRNLSTAQLATISAVMVAARIFDAFNDPIMGAVIDRTKSRFGKFKPWMAIGCILSCAVIVFCFSNTLQGWDFVVAVGVLYIVYSIVFTMNDISYWGMLSALSSKPDSRNKLTSRTILGAGIGIFLTSAIVPTFTAGKHVIGGNAITAYRTISIVMCVAFVVFQFITVIFAQERRDVPISSKNEVSGIKAIFKTISRNDQLRWGALCMLLFTLGGGTIAVLNTYIYFEFGYNGALIPIFGILGSLVGLAQTLIFPAVAKRFSRKNLMTMGAVVTSVGYILILVCGVFLPKDPWLLKFIALCVCNVFVAFGANFMYMIMMVSMSNTVEYNEWKFGVREEGIIFSVRPFMAKLGAAVNQFMVIAIYLIVGVTVFTNKISALENDAARGMITANAKTDAIAEVIAGVPSSRTTALLVCIAVIPIIVYLVCAYIYRKKYTITETQYDAMLKDIEQKTSVDTN